MLSRYIDNFDYSSRFRILKGGKISLVVSALLGSAIIASAAPTGGVVTSGNATISQSGNVTNINQSTQKASINWQGFSINSNETVNFNQPNVNSITLNRVIGNERSVIDGALNANGQVWILNSNGVLFNKNAKVNTAGILATTKDISDANFQAGNYKFSGDSTASVVNMGTIEASDSGYVALLANTVSNDGTIKAYKGTVHLTGAKEATINLNGNSIVSLSVNKGVLDALVENKGAVIADGGKIYLTTNAVDEILKGVVNNSGVLEANSMDDVMGHVEVFAHGGTANVSGTIEAKGGFVETSGKDLKVADGTVIKAKKWLIDPTNVIVDSEANGGTITATTIEQNLANSQTGEIEIQADSGDITVNQAINIFTQNNSGYTVGGLTLTAGKDININSTITVGPEAYLGLNYGWNGTAYNGSNGATIYGNGGKITFGMNADKDNFAGKVVFAPNENTSGFENSSIYINDVEQIIIRTKEQLQELSNDARGYNVNSSDEVAIALNGNFVLASDLDMTNISFVPIGQSHGTLQDYSLDFKGTFNGLGHTISNLTLKTAGDNNQFKSESGTTKQAAGLFGNIAGDASISSIRLDHVTSTNDSTTNSAPTAALVGSARSLTKMVGQNLVTDTPTIHNNMVTWSTIQATGTGGNVGAIVGYAESATISGNVVTTTTVSSDNDYAVGGIAGSVYRGFYAPASIIDNYVGSSTIKSAYGKVGGIVGFTSRLNPSTDGVIVDNSTVKDSFIYTTGTIQGSYGAGGIIGTAYGETEIKNSSVENSTIAAMQDAGGIVGYMDMGEDGAVKITNSFYNLSNTKIGDKTGDNVGGNVAGVITFGGVDNDEYTSWLPSKTMTVSGLTLTDGYYQINSVADFRKMLAYGYDSANKFKLTSNLALTDGLYLAVLRGELDGNNKTISGLNVSQSYNSNIGLIGRLEGGTVKNLTLTSPTLNGYSYVGGIVGSAKQNYAGTLSPTISNVTVNNFTFSYTREFDVPTQHIDTSVYNIGAIAGEVSNARLSNLTASGTIAVNLTANNERFNWVSADYIGGLLGGMYNSSLDTATSSVIIDIDVLAKAHTTLSKNGNQAGISNIGGVIGDGSDNSLIKNVSSTGDITLSATIETTVTPEGETDDKEGSVSIEGVGGLFGNIGQSYIKNSTATNVITLNTNGDMYGLGGVAGYTSDSLYDTITTSGNILVNLQPIDNWFENVGGAFGETSGDILKDVDSTRNITITGSTMWGGESIGGLIGNADTTNITSSSYTGTIDLSALIKTDDNRLANVGGLVGNNNGDIEDKSYAYFRKTIAATVSTNDKLAQKDALLAEYNLRADVIALKALGYTLEDNSWGNEGDEYRVKFSLVTPEMEWGVIKDSTASINIKAANFQNVGGLVGNMDTEDGGEIINSSVIALNDTSKIEGYSNVGGLVGSNSYGNITDSHATINVKANSTEDANVGGLVGYNEGGSSLDYDDTIQTPLTEIYSESLSLNVSWEEADAFTANLKAELEQSLLDANPGYVVDYNGIYFYGDTNAYTLDGGITLVKAIAKGTISNSYATGTVTSVGGNTGGLVGSAYETIISDSYATGAVIGTMRVGGLVGTMKEDSIIETSYSTGTVNGADAVGGLVGYATGSEIVDSYHTTGKVTGSGGTEGITGGLVGILYGNNSISGSYATSEVEGEAGVGGLIGSVYTSSVENSYATGKVTASGLDFEGVTSAYAGGLAGSFAFSSLTKSYATGEVIANGVVAGGLLGNSFQNESIEESYATGKVTGTSQVGGLIGQDSGSTISNVYSSGEVVASGDSVGSLMGQADGTTLTNSYASGKITLTGEEQINVKGLIGNKDATVANSFYDKTVNAGMADESTRGKTTTELKTLATYTGIVDGAWNMSGENGNYPILGFQTEDAETTWVMAAGDMPVDPDPIDPTPVDPTPVDPEKEINKVITTIVNAQQVDVKLPNFVTDLNIINNINVPNTNNNSIILNSPVQNNSFTNQLFSQLNISEGQGAILVSTPIQGLPSQRISMNELGALSGNPSEVRVALGNGSIVELLNGGVNLVDGLQQEFYVQKTETTKSKGRR